MSQPVEGGSSESRQVGEIEDQLRNQERILAQINESVIAQHRQLLGQEAEAQSYALKLENLKSKRSQDHMEQEEATSGTPGRVLPVSGSTTATPKTSGSLTLLRQKVEENRLKVAQRGRREMESKRELEEKVQALKSQLEEMQKVPAVPTVPYQNPVDTQMIVLQEQIQAKDSLIEARTRAITLLSEDFSRKRKEVVDQLEETREEMRRMQTNFIACDEQYKAEIKTKDSRLFELESQVKALTVKIEQTEEIGSVLAYKENLERQVEELCSIREEKQCMEDKLKELSTVLDAQSQKEVEMVVLLEEKDRLHQQTNKEKEEKISSMFKEKQTLLHELQELRNVSDIYRQKEKEFSLLMEEKQSLQHKIDELTKLSDVNQQKEGDLSVQLKKNQILQKRVDKLYKLLEANDKKTKEMNIISNEGLSTLSKEKQSLENKVEELSRLLDASHQKERELESKLTSDLNMQPEQKLEQCCALLEVYRETIKTICTQRQESGNFQPQVLKEAFVDNINEAEVEELSRLVDVSQQNKKEQEFVAKALDASELRVKELSELLASSQLKERELSKTVSNFESTCKESSLALENMLPLEEKVDELTKLLDASQYRHNEELKAVAQEKELLENKVSLVTEQCNQKMATFKAEQERFYGNQEALIQVCETLEQDCSQLLKEKKQLEEKVDKLKEKEQLEEKIQHMASRIEASERNEQQLSYDVRTSAETVFRYHTEKQALQDKVLEMSKIIQSHEENVHRMIIEKHILEEKVQELEDTVFEGREENSQVLRDHLNASQQEHREELALVATEKRVLEEKVQELTNTIKQLEQNSWEMSDQLNYSEKRQCENLEKLKSVVTEKKVLKAKVRELSNIIETNVNAYKMSQEKHVEALSKLSEQKQLLEDKVTELRNLIEHKEQDLQVWINQIQSEQTQKLEELAKQEVEIEELVLEREHQMSELTSCIQQKQSLLDKVTELSDLVNILQHGQSEEMGRILEEKNSLESEVKQLSKAMEDGKEKQKLALSKAHKKITDLKRYVNSLEKADDSSAIMVDLEHRIAELEEEKGNLQLHVVDFEELKALNTDLSVQLETLQGQKITAEMKSVELEEELDHHRNHPGYLDEQSAIRNDLQCQLHDQVEKYNLLQQSLVKRDDELSEKMFECDRLIKSQRELELTCERLSNDLTANERNLIWHKIELHEILKTSLVVVNIVNDFYSSVSKNRLCDTESKLVLQEYIKASKSNKGYIHDQDTPESNTKITEFLRSKMVCIATTLQEELRQLQNYKDESVSLRNEVDRLKGLLNERQQVEVQETAQATQSTLVQCQLHDQVEKCNLLQQTLVKRDGELSEKTFECDRLIQSQRELELTCERLSNDLAANEATILDLEGNLIWHRVELQEILKTSLVVVNIVREFYSEVSNIRLCETKSELALQEYIQAHRSNQDYIYNRETPESNAKVRELLRSTTLSITTTLQEELGQLQNYKDESVSLRYEVDRLQGLLNERQQVEVQETAQATQSTLVQHAPGNAVSATHLYKSQIRELEQDKVRLSEELRSAQIRCGKLVKKIKSLKMDHDSLVNKSSESNKGANDDGETKNVIDSLERRVCHLQSELHKKNKPMEEASTQADDNRLTWLSNEYESVKVEIQHLVEEIHSKDGSLAEATEELRSRRDQCEELLEEVAMLRETMEIRDADSTRPEEMLADKESLQLLRQKEEQVARLEQQLRTDTDPPHRQLDESLYMLHQKEVRCDELTLELMQLLEERDTLQLRLSTVIGQYEELRASCAQSTPSPTASDSPLLSNKLQEVQSMGRQQRSMALQQRADTTVSRDNQSQSETLINWIRGRTTPKVVHI